MDDRDWMRIALQDAENALQNNEVPVGAVVVKDDMIVSRAHNRCVYDRDVTAHAELLALKKAYTELGTLDGCTLYVTLEPCAMCAAAMIHMRLPRLVYGAFDSDCGCCGSKIDLTDHWFDHTVETTGGILESECSALLKSFFKDLRKE